MSLFIPGDILAASTRSLAHSALPHAPVEPDEPPRVPPARRLIAWMGERIPRTSRRSPAPRVKGVCPD